MSLESSLDEIRKHSTFNSDDFIALLNEKGYMKVGRHSHYELYFGKSSAVAVAEERFKQSENWLVEGNFSSMSELADVLDKLAVSSRRNLKDKIMGVALGAFFGVCAGVAVPNANASAYGRIFSVMTGGFFGGYMGRFLPTPDSKPKNYVVDYRAVLSVLAK